MKLTSFLQTAVAMLCFVSSAEAARHAMVIGNRDYADTGRFPDLATAANDAVKMADLLRQAGFTLHPFTRDGKAEPSWRDLSRLEMEDALTAFAAKIQPGDDAVVYFAGHGVQYENKVYLMGCNAEMKLKGKFAEEASFRKPSL